MKSGTFNINTLSPHLFWDVDINKLSFNINREFIIKRILEYGLLTDWMQLNRHLEIDEIADIVSGIKDLDNKSLSFIAAISKIPIEKFLCYTTQQSTTPHWNY